jgi:ABC-type polysaccharide/polyol phosphate transport system ATPase subunit
MNLPTVSSASALAASRPIIQLDQVTVRYRIPHERIWSFKEYTIRQLQRTIVYNDFEALQKVDLTVYRGEMLGIIGSNGAGKSTLLKVVARVLRPTTGRIRVWGHVAPLLELGSGFDFELTGRENIFLNGAILGQSERDIAQRFERIVEFAGLADFIDAPLRTYSSGMVARLGFAIATDLEPDILIVDEVLSVGDADFKAKSEKRLKQFRENGTTILLVSHAMESILSLCQRVVWLKHGQVQQIGQSEEVVKAYLKTTPES